MYIRETSRQLGVRLAQHRKEAEKTGNSGNFTGSTSRSSANEYRKSAITDHVCQNNHAMDWEAGEIVERESDKFIRCIKESIHIRTNSPTMNRDEGAYQLSPIWNQLISIPDQVGGGDLDRVTFVCFA